jgi:hypothetical protein
MKPDLSRRRLMQAMSATALSASASPAAEIRRLPVEGAGTPKLCMNISEANLNEAGMRRVKQLGVATYCSPILHRSPGTRRTSAPGWSASRLVA